MMTTNSLAQRILVSLGALALYIAASCPALAQSSYQILDANSVKQIIKSFNCSSQICPGAVLMDTTGAAIGTSGNPLYVTGGSGSNASVSTTGTTIPGSATYAGMLQGGNLVGLTGTGGSLNVNITGGGSGGGAVTLASGAVASGAYSAGSIAAGAFVSGSVLSGAYASGAIVDLTNLSTPIAPNTATATKGILIAGQYNSTQATFTNSQQGALQLSARGAQYVAVGADGFAVTGTVNPTTIGNWGLQVSTQNSATPTNGGLVLGQFNTTPTTITTGNVSPLQIDNAGNLLVNVKAGGAGGGAVYGPTAVGSANANPPVVIGGTATGAAGQNVEGVAVKPASTASVATDLSLVTNESPNSQLSVAIGTSADAAYTGSGSASTVAILKGIYSVATGAIPLNINGTATGQTGLTPGVAQSGTIVASNTDQTSVGGTAILKGAGATGAGSPRTTVAQDTTTLAGSAPGTAGTPSANVVSVQGVSGGIGVPTSPQAIATGGASESGAIAPATPAAASVKGSAGTIYGVQLFNVSGSAAWLKLYDSASVTCGSGTPIKRILIPANSTAANGGGTVISFGPTGAVTATGIGYCVTGLIADTDTTAITATSIAVNVDFK
jgi:hypothetical protein